MTGKENDPGLTFWPNTRAFQVGPLSRAKARIHWLTGGWRAKFLYVGLSQFSKVEPDEVCP